MTNHEIIAKGFAKFREKVRIAGDAALCEQMDYTMRQSLSLHEALEDGTHTHHLEESDSHGWAVVDKDALVGSGASSLAGPNENGSAENVAIEAASGLGGGQRGVFVAVMSDYDSYRFETKVQELLRNSALMNFPWCYLKGINMAK